MKVLVNPEIVLGSPVVTNDNELTFQGVPVQIDVLANDQNLPDKQSLLTVSINNEPSNGAAVVGEALSIEYTPAPEFFGIDQFTYSVTEDNKRSNVAVVTVRIDEPLEVVETDPETSTDPVVDDEVSSSSGGGCTMGDPNAPIDPVLPLLVLIALIGIFYRRYKHF